MTNLKTILVTGSSDGIGLSTCEHLYISGHQILVHGRNEGKALEAIDKILVYGGQKPQTKTDRLIPVWGDLSVMSEVVKLAEQVQAVAPSLSVLINNAGVYMNQRTLTADNFEMTFAVNYLAPFLLTQKLLPLLKNQISSRVVNVSSVAHTKGHLKFDNLNGEKHFEAYQAYSVSKLMEIMMTRVLAALNKVSNVTFNSLHPGVIDTKLLRAGFNIQGDGVDVGCQTSIYLATSPQVEGVTGKYFVNSKEAIVSRYALDDKTAIQLWRKTEELLKIWL